jgi:hypothetical protein
VAKKKKLLLKAVLNGRELFDALFEHVLHKYGSKKHLKDALDKGMTEFVTKMEMPLDEKKEGHPEIKSIIVEIYAREKGSEET